MKKTKAPTSKRQLKKLRKAWEAGMLGLPTQGGELHKKRERMAALAKSLFGKE